jgi:predicted RecA/RadA family phage recombinase
MPLQIQDGDVIGVSATGGCTAGTIAALNEIAGVYLDTYAAASTNTNVPVALEGVFSVTKKAGANLDFAVGEKVYALSTGGAYKAVMTATGGTLPLGIAVEAAVTGATTVKVKLCTV